MGIFAKGDQWGAPTPKDGWSRNNHVLDIGYIYAHDLQCCFYLYTCLFQWHKVDAGRRQLGYDKVLYSLQGRLDGEEQCWTDISCKGQNSVHKLSLPPARAALQCYISGQQQQTMPTLQNLVLSGSNASFGSLQEVLQLLQASINFVSIHISIGGTERSETLMLVRQLLLHHLQQTIGICQRV